MSDLSKAKNAFESFLDKVLGYVPAEAQPTVTAAASDVHSALSDAESAAVTTASSVGSSLISKDLPEDLQGIAGILLALGIDVAKTKLGIAA